MSKGSITKVMKYELRYLDGCGDFHDMQKQLWELQKKTQEILNRTIQMAYHLDFQSREHHRETGEYLNVKAETGKSERTYYYDRLTKDYPTISTANLAAAINQAWSKYGECKNNIFSGKMSLPSFRSNQPIILRSDSVKLTKEPNKIILETTLFSRAYKKQEGLKTNPRFRVQINDNTQRSIIENVLSGEYGCGESKLVYDKKKWFLLLTYNFTPKKYELDPNKILGVDLGVKYAIYASIYNEHDFLKIEGGEVAAFAKKHEDRIRSMQKQAPFCGEGRIGHGTKTRVANVYQAKDRIASFRDTINHRYSKALVEFAVKHQCGVIQMEDLTGIKEDRDYPRVLTHWTYYDLQNKIENKAEEYGIVVKKVDPRYTSQRCSNCGCIDAANRKSQETFFCIKCRFEKNADYNASQNLAIKNISDIIKKQISAKTE